jgi:hypothetical protein
VSDYTLTNTELAALRSSLEGQALRFRLQASEHAHRGDMRSRNQDLKEAQWLEELRDRFYGTSTVEITYNK